MELKRQLMWPTPIYSANFPDFKTLNKNLIKQIKAWSKKDKSVAKTNAGGGWHSPTDMNLREEYNPLTQHLFNMIAEVFKDYGMEPKIGLGNMKLNQKKNIPYYIQWVVI